MCASITRICEPTHDFTKKGVNESADQISAHPFCDMMLNDFCKTSKDESQCSISAPQHIHRENSVHVPLRGYGYRFVASASGSR